MNNGDEFDDARIDKIVGAAVRQGQAQVAADHGQARITLPAEQFRDPPGYVGVERRVEAGDGQRP
jgi:hypothetical protein